MNENTNIDSDVQELGQILGSFQDQNTQDASVTNPDNNIDSDVQELGSIMSGTQNTNVDNQTVDPISLIKKYFPESEWSNAEKVMQAESGGKADNIGDNYPINGQTIPSVGLFQIRTLPGRPTAEQLKDPEFNVKYAADMWKSQGWEPWTTARKMRLPGTTPL